MVSNSPSSWLWNWLCISLKTKFYLITDGSHNSLNQSSIPASIQLCWDPTPGCCLWSCHWLSSLGRLQGDGNCRGLWTQMPNLGHGTRRVTELLFSFGHLKHKYSPVSCHGCLLFLIYLPGFTKTVLPYEEYYGIGSFYFVLF